MSWIKHTGSRYHNQDTGYYCGAAAAMMILAEIGVPYSSLDQDDLYTSNHNHNQNASGWYTDAVGLKYTLNDRRPSGTYYFVVYKPTTEAEGTRKIVYTLHHYNVSPAVLVYGCQHWIVVPGVQTDVEPVEGTSYTVEGLWLHNPVYHSGDSPPPHSATDDCGTGGSQGTGNEFVTYAEWQSTYFTGCTAHDAGGVRKYISVCDPDPPILELPLRRELKYRVDGRRLLLPDQAIEFSHIGLEEYQLFEDDRVAEALEGASPGEPMPVLRLDRPNTYYYLVPWEGQEGVTALSRVDARFGLFQGIQLQAPGRQRVKDRDEILRQVAYQRFELPKAQGRLLLYPEAAALSPTLVWKPCVESYSPHLPFYQYTVGSQNIYVRLDGEVFTELTTPSLMGD